MTSDLAILTPEQRRIIEVQSGPVLVLAGVGCGKTLVLTHRATRALEQGVSPRSMLAVTFTNRAAHEMRERLLALSVRQDELPLICTFHALCMRVLRRNGKSLAIEPNFIVWDESDSYGMNQIVKKPSDLQPKVSDGTWMRKRLLTSTSKSVH